MKKLLTVLTFAFTLNLVQAQFNIPPYTFASSTFLPVGPTDGSSGTTLDPAYFTPYANGQYIYHAHSVAGNPNGDILVPQQGGVQIEIYIPPYVSNVSLTLDDPALAAGNPVLYELKFEEGAVGSTSPTSHPGGSVSTWHTLYSANKTYNFNRDAQFFSTGSIARITVYNGLNWGYTTVPDNYPGAINLDKVEVVWFILSADEQDYINWANGCDAFAAGSIPTQQTVTEGYTGVVISSITPASGGNGLLSYQWQYSVDGTTWIDDVNNVSENYSVPDGLTAGVYYARRIATNDCGDQISNTFELTVTANTAGIENQNSLSELKIFPNPATDVISFTNAIGQNIQITNLSGQVVLHIQNYQGEPIDISSIESGNYILISISENKTSTHKLIIH